MQTVTSADGTTIAYDQLGDGPPLILVSAAFSARGGLAPLGAALADRFTVLNYDRRGRGDSGDTAPYTVEREIEDIAALISRANGSAAVFGYSSGANLALMAAAAGIGITKLALYEPPFIVDGSRPPLATDLPARLAELVSAGRRGDAVELYQREAVGMPEEIVVGMRQAPFRPALEAIAHTLSYDAAIVGDLSLPRAVLTQIEAPTLVLAGAQSPPLMRNAARAVADALPNGRHRTLEGQTHEISTEITAAAMTGFLAA